MNVLAGILGKRGEPPRCNQFVHWWRIDAKTGDKCMCGQKTKEPRKRKAKP